LQTTRSKSLREDFLLMAMALCSEFLQVLLESSRFRPAAMEPLWSLGIPLLPYVILLVLYLQPGKKFSFRSQSRLRSAVKILFVFMVAASGAVFVWTCFSASAYMVYFFAFMILRVLVFLDVLYLSLQMIQDSENKEKELNRTQKELYWLRTHDDLTELYNRASFFRMLDEELSKSDEQRDLSGLLFLDVDRFHEISDNLGPLQADRLLAKVAEKLKYFCTTARSVFRVGEDKFMLFLPRGFSKEEAEDLARRILFDFSRPLSHNDIHSYISVSIGIAGLEAPNNRLYTLKELLRNVDLALDVAKLDRNTYKYFIPGMLTRGNSRLQMLNYLRQAIERDELILHFQPQLNEAQEVVCAEALLRWNNPVLGMVPPSEFIPLAEESGLIISLGEWVISQACAELAFWRESGLDIPLAINVSARQLKDPHIEWTLLETLKKHGLRPQELHLEITESSIFEESVENLNILENLHALGFNLSIDDFGTGYANLSYLKRLPVSSIKIDRSFIRDLPDNIQDMAVVEAICGIAKNLGYKTIAEGVDRECQLEVLKNLQCDLIQGFFYSRPLASKEFLQFCLKVA